MSEPRIIRLTRDSAWVMYRAHLVDLGLLAPHLPEPIFYVTDIAVGGKEKISRALVQSMFEAGWRGLEQIPADCVVD
jgi:hypothetical protein